MCSSSSSRQTAAGTAADDQTATDSTASRNGGATEEGAKEQIITPEEQEHQYEVEETWREGAEKVRPRSVKGEELKQQQEETHNPDEEQRIEGRNSSILKRNTRGSSR